MSAKGIGGAPAEQEDPRADLIWGTVPTLVDDAAQRISALDRYCQELGRSVRELTVAVALTDGSPAMLPELARIGVTELVLVAAPPESASAATAWVAELAAEWGISPDGASAQTEHPPRLG